jgi:hypothetical protein
LLPIIVKLTVNMSTKDALLTASGPATLSC